jgi:hypothetical protein
MWRELAEWKEASVEDFAEITNHAFRRLHAEAVDLDVVKRRFMSDGKPPARAMLIRLRPILEAAARGRNNPTLSGFTLDQIELSPETEALIISTTEQQLVTNLILGLTEGRLDDKWPADWFGAQNTRDCVRALNNALTEHTVIYPAVEGVLAFSDADPTAEFKIYQFINPAIADIAGNDQRLEPQS